MSHPRVRFDDLPWQDAAPGLRLKQCSHGSKRIRLVEFSPAYDDQAWCEVGHTGYVLNGSLTFIYDDGPVRHSQGDAFRIEDGQADRHRTRVEPGETALVFLVEDDD